MDPKWNQESRSDLVNGDHKIGDQDLKMGDQDHQMGIKILPVDPDHGLRSEIGNLCLKVASAVLELLRRNKSGGI